jgi:transposase
VSANPCLEAVCPKCGHRFAWFKLYKRGDIANMFGVTVETVKTWLKQGLLGSRLHFLGTRRPIAELIDSIQLAEFLESRYPIRDERATDRTNQAQLQRRESSRRAQRAMLAKRVA